MVIRKHHKQFGLLLLLGGLSFGYAFGSTGEEQDNNTEPQSTETTHNPETELPAVVELDPAVVAEKNRAIGKYEQRVQELESSGGVYQVQLSEILLGLGETYQSLNLHTEAITAFNRSLHINRVNSGLYSINQLTILEQMIKSNTALKDWENLYKNYNYLYWLSKRNYGDNDPQLLPVIDRLGRWHLQAYTSALDEQPFRHLLDADDLYDKAITIIETQHGLNDPRLLNALYGIALTNYQMAAHVSSAEELDEIRYGFRNSGNGRNQRFLQEEFARQELILRSYAKGKKAMTRIVDIHANNQQLTTDMHALALTHLGDWYLLFNKRNSAAKTYDQAYKLMSADENKKQEFDKFFSQPRMLPTIKLPVENEEAVTKNENPSYVVATFNVSSTGRARNIEIIESNPVDDTSLKRKARRSIASSKFRPRFENGKPVETTGIKIRYIFDE